MHAEDIAEIQQAAAQYSYVINFCRLDRLDKVYSSDGVYDGTDSGVGVHDGIESIAGFLGSDERKASGGMHFTTNVLIDTWADDGVSATGVAQFLIVHAERLTAGLRLTTGVYHDEWTKTAEGWRIGRRASYVVASKSADFPWVALIDG